MIRKYCKSCSKIKDINDFHKSKDNKAYPDNHINWCKECMKEYKKKNKKVKEEIKLPVFRVEHKTVIVSFD
jgi:hypothetical protein